MVFLIKKDDFVLGMNQFVVFFLIDIFVAAQRRLGLLLCGGRNA